MEKNILFKEQQKFKQWWVWLLFLLSNGFLFWALYKQIYLGEAIGDKPLPDNGLFFFTAFTISLSSLFFLFRLDTKLDKTGVYVRFFPFQKKFMHYAWQDVKSAYIRKYSPLRDFGGWGYRISLGGNGKAYNVHGNQGLQLEFKDGKKLLIGTQMPERMNDTLRKLFNLEILRPV